MEKNRKNYATNEMLGTVNEVNSFCIKMPREKYNLKWHTYSDHLRINLRKTN